MKKYILNIIVQNNSGVLARISALFGRRGFNIESLTVSTTNNPKISKIVMVVLGDEYILEQIKKQVQKLVEVISVEHLIEEDSFCKELLIVRIRTGADLVLNIDELSHILSSRVLEQTNDTITLVLADMPSRVDAYLEILEKYDIIDMCRTGITAMKKSKNTKSL